MKTFGLRCPQCQKFYQLKSSEVHEWWDGHVGPCRIGRISREVIYRTLGGVLVIRDDILLAGRALFEVFREGELDGVGCGGNAILNVGRAALIAGAALTAFAYGQVGTSTTAPNPTQTDLLAALSPRNAGSISYPDSYTNRLTVNYGLTDCVGTIGESSRYNNPSGATDISRALVSPTVPKDNQHMAVQTHDLTYAAGS